MSKKKWFVVIVGLLLLGILLEDKVLDPLNATFFHDRTWLPN